MSPRKTRLPVVFDTNVILGFFLSRTRRGVNGRVFDAWLITRHLQLIVSQPVIDEYLEIIDRLGIAKARRDWFHGRLLSAPTVTRINLGKRFTVSRDADDDILLATAHAGRADYLVTHDRDLLDIPAAERRVFAFEIVRPLDLLQALDL